METIWQPTPTSFKHLPMQLTNLKPVHSPFINYLFTVVHDTRISFREEPKTGPVSKLLSTKNEQKLRANSWVCTGSAGLWTGGKSLRVGVIAILRLKWVTIEVWHAFCGTILRIVQLTPFCITPDWTVVSYDTHIFWVTFRNRCLLRGASRK